MNARAQLMLRSMGVLLGVSVLGCAIGLALGSPSRVLVSTGFTLVFAVAWTAIRRGWIRVGAAVVVGPGAALVLGLVASHGYQSHYVVYLPLLCATSWAWLGRRVGAAMIVAAGLAMVATWVQPRAVETDAELLIAYLVAIGALVTFTTALIRDLRRTVELAARRAEDAEAAAARAMAANASRTRFVGAATHELQAPLDVVLRNTEALRSLATPEWARDLQNIERAALQLRGLIDDVLDIGRADAPDFPLSFERTDLGELVREVAEMSGVLVASQGNTLAFDIPAPVCVTTDRARTRQIVTNLLSNASKYTQHGRITVRVTTTGDVVQVAVADTGIGVPPDKVGMLFQPFVQLHEGVDRRPGVGLGLALSRRLAERLGGTIELTAPPTGGSVFTLTLPRPCEATPPG